MYFSCHSFQTPFLLHLRQRLPLYDGGKLFLPAGLSLDELADAILHVADAVRVQRGLLAGVVGAFSNGHQLDLKVRQALRFMALLFFDRLVGLRDLCVLTNGGLHGRAHVLKGEQAPLIFVLPVLPG